MKKIFTVFAVLFSFVMQWQAHADIITAPEAGNDYYIVHSSGYLLTYTGSTLQINNPGEGQSQTFQFVPVEGAADRYNIVLPDGKLLGSDSSYSVKFYDDAADTYAQFKIEVSYLSDWVVLRNVGRNACYGTDNNRAGDGVYTDKGGNDGKHLWNIVLKTGAVYTGVLENTIANAENTLNSAVVGTSVGNYPQAAVDALASAVATAKDALTATEQTAVNEAAAALSAAVSAFKQQQVVMFVDADKQYLLVQKNSGLVLASDGKKAVVQDRDGSAAQKFSLVHIDGTDYGYNLKLADGNYIITSGNWDTAIGTDGSADVAKFTFSLAELTDDGVAYYNIRGTKGLLGSDNTKNGSTVYSNKGDGTNARWTLEEVVEGVLVTEGLEHAIEAAEDAQQGITIGTEPNNYPQAAYDELSNAIQAAKDVLATATTQDALNEAAAALIASTNKFKATKIVFAADPEKQYYFMQKASGYVLGINSSNVGDIEMLAGTDNQKFRLVPEFEGCTSVYSLQLADGESYFTRKGGWDTTVGTDATASVAKWEFEIADLAQGHYRLKKYGEGGYLGSDDVTAGSWVYTNKGDNDRGRWSIIEVVPGELVTYAYDAILAEAEQLLANTVVGEDAWCWTQESVDALAAAIDSAKNASYTTQEELNALTSALSDAIAAYNSAQIQPYFKPEDGVEYRFSIRKYDTKFLTNIDGSVSKTASYEVGNDGQHWTFQEAAGTDHAYIVKNGSLVLGYDGTVTEVADDEAPMWRTVYCGTIDYIDRFALVQAEDPTKVMTFSSGNTFVIQTLSTTNNAHQGRFYRVDPVNDANLANLEYAIARAESKLAGVDRGNEIGQWSDAKCDAMQAQIDLAKTYYSGKTQEEVDGMYTALTNYVAEFLANPNTVIKDALDAEIARGEKKANDAEIGAGVGQYLWSDINGFVAALNDYKAQAKAVTEQDACDALTEEVKNFVDAFNGHETEIDVKTVLDDAIKVAEAIYEAEKDNVGTEQGQRPQNVIDAFASAINTAKGVATPNDADLSALLDAVAAFEKGAISVNRTALRNAIAAAQADKYSDLSAGEYDGQYPQDKIDEFNQALASAVAVEADMDKTQDEIDAATKALNAARTALDAAKVTINFKALDAAINKADALIATVTLVGEGEGACPQADYDAFKGAVNAAKAIDRASIKQDDVNANETALLQAIDAFAAAVKNAVGLEAVIDEAQTMLHDAVAGFKPGNYPSTAIAELKAAIDNAEAANNAAVLSQSDLLAAAANLKQAMDAFKAQVIPANDLTDLLAVISEAEAYIEQFGDEDVNLARALDAASAIVEDPDNYTKTQVANATKDLRSALDKAKENNGVQSIGVDGASVAVVDGSVVVLGLDQYAIYAYTLDGRLVAVAESEALTVAPAMYIIVIRATGVDFRQTILVK